MITGATSAHVGGAAVNSNGRRRILRGGCRQGQRYVKQLHSGGKRLIMLMCRREAVLKKKT